MRPALALHHQYQSLDNAKLTRFIARAQTQAKPIWSGYLSFPLLKQIVKACHPKEIQLPGADYEIFHHKFSTQFRKDGTIWVGYWLKLSVSRYKWDGKPGRPRINGEIISELARLHSADPSLTQEQLARILKISQGSIHNILKKLEVPI